MAFALTNKGYEFSTVLGVPLAHKELADQTAAVTTDTGVVGLKWARVRILIKSGLVNTNTVLFVLRGGTGAALTSPEILAVSPTHTFVTGDSNICIEMHGWSQTGFQSWSLTPTNSGGLASYDVLFDAG